MTDEELGSWVAFLWGAAILLLLIYIAYRLS